MRKWMLVLAATAIAALNISCNQLRARDHLNKGVQEFTATRYHEAEDHFKQACELDPGLAAARLYLATAYMQQYVPGSDTPDNNKFAQAAFDNFKKVLDTEPKNTIAIASIASLNISQKKWDEAQQWFEKLIAVDPNNKEAYYSIGFIAWSKWYPVYGTARVEAGMKPDDPGPLKDKKVKAELKAKWTPVVDAGLAALDKALTIDPEYDDAMAYENLLIREKADLADDKAEYERQIKIADGWMDKALKTKKDKAERKNKGSQGIVLDNKEGK